MKDTVVVVPGLFGGISQGHYRPLAEAFGSNEYYIFSAGSDWEPTDIAEQIRQLEGNKKVICLSCGAMIGNLLANDEDTEVYYIGPYMGVDFINREKKAYAYRLRYLFKGLACFLMAISMPFKWHRWYPLFGGTKPDGWFLSVYAIFKQLKYAFSKTPEINLVDGTVLSYGDAVVEPTAAIRTSTNVAVAQTAAGNGPSHINLREDGEKFGSTANQSSGELGEDAKAYIEAFSKVIARGPH